MSSKNPKINGYGYDYSSITLSVNGLTFSGITSITYNDSVERTKLYGTGSMPVGVTRGQYNCEASLEFHKHEFDRFALAFPSLFDAKFNITIFHQTTGSPGSTDVLVDCRIDNIENSYSAGSDGLVVPVTLNVMEIIRNGKSAFASSIEDIAGSVAGLAGALL